MLAHPLASLRASNNYNLRLKTKSARFRFLVSQHCNHIEELTLDHSSVTDRGIRFLSGWSGGVRRLLFNENPVAAFVPLAADVLQIESLPGLPLIRLDY